MGGTLMGGLAADRFGALRTLRTQLAVPVAMMCLLPLTRGKWPGNGSYNQAMTAKDQLDALQAALQQLRGDTLGVAAFSQLAMQQQSLAAALPDRFNQVLSQLLNRLESSALFTEESCSFSQKALLDSLQLWLDKAAPQLQKS